MKARRLPIPAAIAMVAVMSILSACGYGLAGRTVSLPDHVKVIAVTAFTNRTSDPDAGQAMTQAVLRELLSRGRWRVVPDASGSDVDAVVSGTMTGLNLTVKTINLGQPTRVEIFITAAIELKDLRNNNKMIWSNPSLVASEEFPVAPGTQPNTDATAFLRQSQDARLRLANKFARTVVASMLEGM